MQGGAEVVYGQTESIDTGDRRDDDHVATFDDGACGEMAEPVDVLVDARGLGNERVRVGKVRLRGEVAVVFGLFGRFDYPFLGGCSTRPRKWKVQQIETV